MSTNENVSPTKDDASLIPPNKYIWVARTHTGMYRMENEDSLAVSQLNLHESGKKNKIQIADSSGKFGTNFPGSIFMVADGMGGGIEGKHASWVVTREFSSLSQEIFPNLVDVEKKTDDHEKIFLKLNEITQQCNEVLGEENDKFINDPNKVNEYFQKKSPPTTSNLFPQNNKIPTMGSTLSAVWLSHDNLYLSHVGDSKIYHYHDNEMDQLSIDHSYVGNLLRSGEINERQARTHPRRSILTQVMGADFKTIIPQIEHHKLKKGSAILICSDGLNDGLWDKNIHSSLNFYLKDKVFKDENEAQENLIELADLLIASTIRASGRDNITVILVYLF